MSALDVDAIRARCDAATPGDWWVEPEHTTDTSYSPARVMASVPADYWSQDCDEMQLATGTPGDAEFIAHAREDVPALLAALTDAEAERDEHIAAHGLMVKQFEVMRREKEYGWQIAESLEDRDAELLAENEQLHATIARVRDLCNNSVHIAIGVKVILAALDGGDTE